MNYLENLDKILDEIDIPVVCPKCKSRKIVYREKKTKLKWLVHVGAYCENGHFVKWMKQTKDVMDKVETKGKLF